MKSRKYKGYSDFFLAQLSKAEIFGKIWIQLYKIYRAWHIVHALKFAKPPCFLFTSPLSSFRYTSLYPQFPQNRMPFVFVPQLGQKLGIAPGLRLARSRRCLGPGNRCLLPIRPLPGFRSATPSRFRLPLPSGPPSAGLWQGPLPCRPCPRPNRRPLQSLLPRAACWNRPCPRSCSGPRPFPPSAAPVPDN